ncbi:MAG: hypothetical protein HYW38_00980 [Candidatus Colwellbacteria bacterium]|nr:hypothetical protein [Candidatus Colwellbacteria bacterium]
MLSNAEDLILAKVKEEAKKRLRRKLQQAIAETSRKLGVSPEDVKNIFRDDFFSVAEEIFRK